MLSADTPVDLTEEDTPPPTTLERLPDDLLCNNIFPLIGDVGVLRFGCCSTGCSALVLCDCGLWRQLCLSRWPHLNNVFAAVAGTSILLDKILPSHLTVARRVCSQGHGADILSLLAEPRALHRARVLCGTSVQLQCDKAIAVCQELLSAQDTDATVRALERLGALLRHIDEGGVAARSAPEYRAWLWLVGSLLLEPKARLRLLQLSVLVESDLDRWYESVENGLASPEHNRQLLISAFERRSALEVVLTVLRALQYDYHRMHNAPPGLLLLSSRGSGRGGGAIMQAEAAEAAEAAEEEAEAAEEEGDDWSWPFESRSVDLAIRELRAAAVRINRSLLSMRSEGCDLSVPSSFRPLPLSKRADAWWWFLEEQMHVSGGNPYVMPQPIWMDADLAGRAPSPAAAPWDPIRWVR